MGLLDQMLGAAGAATGASGLVKSLDLEPQQGALAGALVGMLAGERQGGLAGLQQSFAKEGLGGAVASWIGTGKNQPISGSQLESVLGPEVVQQLAAKAGIDPRTASAAIAALLPLVVDKLTPQGAIPQQQSLVEMAMGLLGGKR